MYHSEEELKKIVQRQGWTEAARRSLDGDDYERGELEATRKTADNAVEALGKLLGFLVMKGVINVDQGIFMLRPN